MPNELQNKIKRAIDAKPRYHKGIFEKRSKINGIEIYGGAKDLSECETQFWEDLKRKLDLVKEDDRKMKSSTLFKTVADAWMNEVYKPTVGADTFERECSRYQKHIAPVLGKKRIADIRPLDCAQILNALVSQSHSRTAEGVYGLLNRILEFAVNSELIAKNPMRSIKPINHERENGVPLTKEEETTLLVGIRRNQYEAAIIVALYTGLRPCEYRTARIEGDFIVARNCKQKKTKKIVLKKIPITPMLKPYIPLIREKMNDWETNGNERNAGKVFKKILPNHRAYDMRTTFATRCQECGVSEQVTQVFMGHSPRTLLGKVYTKFDDAFLIKEGSKVKY